MPDVKSPTQGFHQGTPRGVDPDTNEKKEKLLATTKDSINKFIKTFFFAAGILLVESLIVWVILGYVFPSFNLTYMKTFLLFIAARLVLRNPLEKKK